MLNSYSCLCVGHFQHVRELGKGDTAVAASRDEHDAYRAALLVDGDSLDLGPGEVLDAGGEPVFEVLFHLRSN